MPWNRLPRVMKYYSPTGRRNHGRPLKRLPDTWDRNGSTSGPTPWKIYDDEQKKNVHAEFVCTYLIQVITTFRITNKQKCSYWISIRMYNLYLYKISHEYLQWSWVITIKPKAKHKFPCEIQFLILQKECTG